MGDQANNLPAKILIVDDDPSVAGALEAGLARYKIGVVKAIDLASALYQYNQNKFEVVLVELDFGPLPGLALIQKWRNHEIVEKRMTGFIGVASSQRTSGQENLAKEIADIEVIAKPIKEAQLLTVLAKALANKQRMANFNELKDRVITPYLKAGNVDKAAEKVQQMLGDLGDRAKRLLLEIYEDASKWQETLDTSLKMLEGAPNDINLVNTAGRMYMKLGRFADAKPMMEKADQLAPQNIQRLNELATMYLEMKEPEKSVERFKQLVKLNPESPDYKFDVFKQLYDAGYDEHAIAFGKQVAQPMEIVRHYNNKGVLLAKEGKVEQAISEYNRALKFYPKFKENFRIYYNLALSHIQLKKPDDLKQAVEFLQKALELDPTFEKAKTTLANLQKTAKSA